MDAEGLVQDLPDSEPGIEGGVGILEDDLHLLAQRTHLLVVVVGDVLSRKVDRSRRGFQQSDDGPPQGGLAASRLSHQAQSFTRLDGQGDVLHRHQGGGLLGAAAADVVTGGDVPDIENRSLGGVGVHVALSVSQDAASSVK